MKITLLLNINVMCFIGNLRHQSSGFIIGLFDTPHGERKFNWRTFEDTDFTRWAPGEPDNTTVGNNWEGEDCLALNTNCKLKL